MRKLILILLFIAVLAFISDSPYFMIKGKTLKDNFHMVCKKFNTPENMVALTVKKGEIYFDRDKWHTPFEVMMAGKTIFEGIIISEDVVSPDSGYAKNGDVNIKFKGANFPWQ